MVRFIFENRYDDEVRNFLDDFFSAQIESLAVDSFNNMGSLLSGLGIEESVEKACPPATRMIILGFLFDTIQMTISLPEDKTEELILELHKWTHRKDCSLQQMQSLIGKLNYASSVVRSGRVYMSRLINTLRGRKINDYSRIQLSDRDLNDIRWWLEHIKIRNGLRMESLMTKQEWEPLGSVWNSDSSSTGLGGWAVQTGAFFHLELTPEWATKDINSLECLALLLCLRKWAELCKGKRVLIQCDNQTTVSVIASGAAKNRFLQACLREIHHICALYSAEIKVIWVQTKQNAIADALSRWGQHPKFEKHFYNLTKGRRVSETLVSTEDLKFQYTTE